MKHSSYAFHENRASAPYPHFIVGLYRFTDPYFAGRYAARVATRTGRFVTVWQQNSRHSPYIEHSRAVPKRQPLTDAHTHA